MRDPRTTRLSPGQTRQYVIGLLKRYGLHARKSAGQRFMINDAILEAIVEACALTSETTVVEVGPGIGNLTTRLAERARRVVALELDEAFRPLHNRIAGAYPNIVFQYCDALDWDWDQGSALSGQLDLSDRSDRSDRSDQAGGAVAGGAVECGDLVIAGNIPYQISTPLVLRLLETPLEWRAAVFTTQREVALRLTARPGPKSHGGLSLKTELIAETEILQEVGPENFHPSPSVVSAVVRLRRRAAPVIAEHGARLRFFQLCDGLFAHRRKQAANSLSQSGTFGLSHAQWVETLGRADIDPQRRGETLSLAEAVRLFELAEGARRRQT